MQRRFSGSNHRRVTQVTEYFLLAGVALSADLAPISNQGLTFYPCPVQPAEYYWVLQAGTNFQSNHNGLSISEHLDRRLSFGRASKVLKLARVIIRMQEFLAVCFPRERDRARI